MATANTREAAAGLGDALHECMLGVGQSLETRGELPTTAEEFARVVTYVLFDQLGGAMMQTNRERREQEGGDF